MTPPGLVGLFLDVVLHTIVMLVELLGAILSLPGVSMVAAVALVASAVWQPPPRRYKEPPPPAAQLDEIVVAA